MSLRFRLAAASALLLAAAPAAAQSVPSKDAAKSAAKATKDHGGKDHSAKDHAGQDHHAKAHAAKDHAAKEHTAKDRDQPKAKAGKMKDVKAAKHHASSGWAELDAYHMLMRNTWHPAESGNDLTALRARAADMAASARALAESTPPQACNSPANRAAALSLAPATTDLAVAVKQGATDAELKTALAALHERFEKLEAGCGAPAKDHR